VVGADATVAGRLCRCVRGGVEITATTLLLAGAAAPATSEPVEPEKLPLAAPHAAPPPAAVDSLAAAMRYFTRAVDDAREAVERHPYYADPAERAAGALYFSSMLLRRIEVELLQDPDFPWFSSIDHRVREGGDNPDQRYLSSPIRGGAKYRIWGRRGGERRIDFQIYAGLPYVPNGGRSVSGLTMEDIRFHPDGTFEVYISPDKGAENRLATASDATSVLVRQTFGPWDERPPGEIHIDRVGFEGKPKPSATPDQVAERFWRAAKALRAIVANWPDFVRRRYVERLPANTLSKPADAVALGGLPGRWYSDAWFELEDDEALILTCWPIPGDYQGIHLTDRWFSSLEYGNRQTSLNGEQSWTSPDGAYRIVISASDPGIQNWLDTTGLRRGVILMRFDGMGVEPFPQAKYPRLEKVKLAELWRHLPSSTPRVMAAEREKTLAARRRAIQSRYHN